MYILILYREISVTHVNNSTKLKKAIIEMKSDIERKMKLV